MADDYQHLALLSTSNAGGAGDKTSGAQHEHEHGVGKDRLHEVRNTSAPLQTSLGRASLFLVMVAVSSVFVHNRFEVEPKSTSANVTLEGGLVNLYGACQDTPGWNNRWTGCAYSEDGKDPTLCAPTTGAQWPSTSGFTCKYYEKKGLCANGKFKAFAMGPGLNSPEKNCCVCQGFKLQRTCKKDTMGGCRWTRKCNGWRGPTDCVRGKCLCKPGYCANEAGTCMQSSRSMAVHKRSGSATQCSRQTPGTCYLKGCEFWRGATQCISFKCHCQPGYCVDEFGRCYKGMGIIRASVVPINERQRQFPGVQVKTALCVSGGGSRALSAALGAFRALRDLGLLQNIDAISSVSGGSWASSILMFAHMDLMTLLGAPTNPSDLSLARLDEQPPPLGRVATAKTNDIAISLKLSGVPFGMLWVATVAKAFLQPFGLDRFDTYMAASLEASQQVKAKNPQYEDAAFQVPVSGRAKTIIINAAVEAPASYKAGSNNVVSFQASPDYTGWPFHPGRGTVDYESANIGDDSLNHVLVGGGMVSTFAFGSSAPTKRGVNGQKGGEDVEMHSPPRPFCLARAVGMSSAAFGGQMSSLPGVGADVNPRATMWPVTSDSHPRPQKEMRDMIGDGGNLENTGFLTALQRGASRTVVLINGADSLAMTPDFCNPGAYSATGKEITGQYANFFGYGIATTSQSEFHKNSQVFDGADYMPTLCEFQKLKAIGKPLTIQRTLRLIGNEWWGIPGGSDVDTVFAILDKSSAFERLLPQDTQDAINSGLAGGLDGYPGLRTMFQNPPDLSSYSPRQINLLSAQTEWAVHQNADIFKAVLSDQIADGDSWWR